jgi:hypothetical protein
MTPAGIGPSGTVDEGRRAKLPQANIAVANRTSHGTIRAKAAAGVASSRRPPTAPPIRLIANRALNESCCAPLTSVRPASPVVTWPGNSATVEVIFAARASSPARMSAGRVMNDPPPASAFCAPAQSPARRSRSIAGQCAMDEQGKRPGAGICCKVGGWLRKRRGSAASGCRPFGTGPGRGGKGKGRSPAREVDHDGRV